MTLPPDKPLSSVARAFRVMMAAGVLSGYAFAFLTPPGDTPAWTICPTRLVTDYPCPSCGFGRGFIFIAHGQWWEAVLLNVWTPLIFFLGFGVSVWLLYEAWTGRDRLDRLFRRHPRAVAAGVVVLVAVRYGALWGLG